jgi:hypothetical protein
MAIRFLATGQIALAASAYSTQNDRPSSCFSLRRMTNSRRRPAIEYQRQVPRERQLFGGTLTFCDHDKLPVTSANLNFVENITVCGESVPINLRNQV